jgi:excisionase family DNA binding protein
MRQRGDHGAPTELVPMYPSSTAGTPCHVGDERVATAADPTALPLMAREVLASLGLQVVVMYSAPPAPPRLVEVDELAAVLGVTRWSVYRWAAQGRIPCVRAGRKVRFELERVIAALRSEGPRVEASPAMRKRPVEAVWWVGAARCNVEACLAAPSRRSRDSFPCRCLRRPPNHQSKRPRRLRRPQARAVS